MSKQTYRAPAQRRNGAARPQSCITYASHAGFTFALLVAAAPVAAQSSYDNVVREAKEYLAPYERAQRDKEMARFQAKELVKAEAAQRDRERRKAQTSCRANGRQWDAVNQFCK